MASQFLGEGSCYEWLAYIRDYHDYKDVWSPTLGEMLQLQVDPTNPHDQFAVAMVKDEMVVSLFLKHVSRAISFHVNTSSTDVEPTSIGSELSSYHRSTNYFLH